MKSLSHKDFIPALGQGLEAKEVQSLLKKLALKPPRLRKEQGEYDPQIYHLAPKLGLNLIFSLPDDVKPAKDAENLLTLTCVQFFSKSPANGISHAFVGELPLGITFGDSQKEVFKKAGKPSSSKQQFRVDHWDKRRPKMSVEYKKDDLTVEMVSYQV